MKNKIMMIILAMMCLFGTSCAANTPSPDEGILDTATKLIESFKFDEGRILTVEVDENEIYNIDVNGTLLMIKVTEGENSKIEMYNFANCSKDVEKVIDSSKRKVVDYINSSTILQDKEKLVQFIENVPAKMASFINEEYTGAVYEEGTIYINRFNVKYLCEWTVVHVLVHALADATNGGISNQRYPYNNFNEVITDIIAGSMKPQMIHGAAPDYMRYYNFAYLYLGIFKEEAIKAYFYGYDEILKIIPEAELDIFVNSLDKINYQRDASTIIVNCINKWGGDMVA